MTLPNAPARIKLIDIKTNLEAPPLAKRNMYHAIPRIANILKELRIYFPITPPHSIPKAIPGFSVK
jgi:hypothetical protein